MKEEIKTQLESIIKDFRSLNLFQLRTALENFAKEGNVLLLREIEQFAKAAVNLPRA